MTPLAHVVQVAILGGALIGVFVLLGGTTAVDYLKARAHAAAFSIDGPWCGCHRAGCPECDPADEADDGDDPGAEWDRAHDRWIDGQAGVA